MTRSKLPLVFAPGQLTFPDLRVKSCIATWALWGGAILGGAGVAVGAAGGGIWSGGAFVIPGAGVGARLGATGGVAIGGLLGAYWCSRDAGCQASTSLQAQTQNEGGCTDEEEQACQRLYQYCVARRNVCGGCLQYCYAQCHWPTHRPQCMNFNFPTDPNDLPPVPKWIM